MMTQFILIWLIFLYWYKQFLLIFHFFQGDVLAELSRISESKEESLRLYSKAIEHYSRSSLDCITLNNLGFAIYERALIQEDPEEKMKLLNEAESKYRGKHLEDNSFFFFLKKKDIELKLVSIIIT